MSCAVDFQVSLLEGYTDNGLKTAIINGVRYLQFNRSNRYCFKVDDLIFKLSWAEYTDSQSKVEAQRWSEIKNTPDKDHFAEVVASGLTECGYYWVAMKLYQLDEVVEKVDRDALKLLYELRSKWQIGDLDITVRSFEKDWQINGRHPNWGLINGKLMIFDYGCSYFDEEEEAKWDDRLL